MIKEFDKIYYSPDNSVNLFQFGNMLTDFQWHWNKYSSDEGIKMHESCVNTFIVYLPKPIGIGFIEERPENIVREEIRIKYKEIKAKGFFYLLR